MRRVQVVFAEHSAPRDFAIPGAPEIAGARSRLPTALARITDEAQLDGVPALPGCG
jgi:hypothetical protein